MNPILVVLFIIILIGIFVKPIEDFVSVTNSPGLNRGGQHPNCPQGFKPYSNGRCVQFCRGCKTGVCNHGECIGI